MFPLQCTYGTTEVPLILRSARDSRTPSSALMQPIDSRSVMFVPISSSGDSSSTVPTSGYKNVNTSVLELVIPATSPDCPHPSIRQHEDGHFHTGDLFLEVVPGHYSFRSRMGEWIRSCTGYWYDAKYVCRPFFIFVIFRKRCDRRADHALHVFLFPLHSGSSRRTHSRVALTSL